MRLVTWNVNSIRARHDIVLDWLRRVQPAVLCLQETKVVDDDFPTDELSRLGYEVRTFGQKSYNGVAIASRTPLQGVDIGFPGDPCPGEARFISAVAEGVRIVCVYVPNGKSVDSPDFPQKIRWLDQLRLAVRRYDEKSLVVCGDFNVAPDERDVYDPERFRGRVHFHPEEHRALGDLMSQGLSDAFRLHHAEGGHYSWWDYRAGAFRRNLGLRIDLMLVSAPMAARCTDCFVDKEPRRAPKPSDHAPVVAVFA